MKSLEELIRQTDSLTYLNALKAALAELKEELTTIEETKEYQIQAIDRARKLIRRIDNQYRAIVKCAMTSDLKQVIVQDVGISETFLYEDLSITKEEEVKSDEG